MTGKLLPCPFCGSNNLEDAGVGAEYVSCGDCGAFGPDCGVDYTLQREIRLGEARNKWNTRCEQPIASAPKFGEEE